MTDEKNPLPEGNDLFRFKRGLDLLRAQGAEIAPGSEWLDLGCNQGQFLRMLVRGHKVRAVGFDDWNPAQRTPEEGPPWEYHKADLERELPWDRPVPFISAFEVLEHMIDTDGFLKRIFDKLMPGGWVLI